MCMIDYADEGAFSVYRASRPVARKEHRCEECGRTIPKGERYFYAFGVTDGYGCSFYYCAHCEVACDWLAKNCGGFIHGGNAVTEDIHEHIEEYPASRFGLCRLEIGIKRGWRGWASDKLLRVPSLPKAISVAEAA